MTDRQLAAVLRSVNSPTAAQVARDHGLDVRGFQTYLRTSWGGARDGDGLRKAARTCVAKGYARRKNR